jgi:site-specific recombinase XerD
LEKTSQYLIVGHYSPHTVRNYLSELRYLFVYYSEVSPQDVTEDMILQYLVYLAKTLKCSKVKCKMAAQSISFFCRHVIKRPYVIPSVIYPRTASQLPPVMDAEEIMCLINTVKNIKHRTIIILLYSSGLRVSEISKLKITDIDSKNMRIKVAEGKGDKDRYSILSKQVLLELRAYYIICKPKEYLFNGQGIGRPASIRSIQKMVQKALIEAGLNSKNYTVHTLRHSFATHLVDNGTDLHTVKELLGHGSIQTTMRYLHLTAERTEGIVNPYDLLAQSEQPAKATSLKK